MKLVWDKFVRSEWVKYTLPRHPENVSAEKQCYYVYRSTRLNREITMKSERERERESIAFDCLYGRGVPRSVDEQVSSKGV